MKHALSRLLNQKSIFESVYTNMMCFIIKPAAMWQRQCGAAATSACVVCCECLARSRNLAALIADGERKSRLSE